MEKTNAAREFWQNYRGPLADHQRTPYHVLEVVALDFFLILH